MALQEEFESQGIWLFRYRSFLPIAILLIGLVVYVYSELNEDQFYFINSPNESYFIVACILVSLLGLIIRILTVAYTPKNTSGRNTAEQIADELNTTGIYSTVRHPLYVGNFFMWLGPALLSENIWFIISFCLLYWVYYERIMYAEEQFLRRKFGEKYLNWASGVPAFMPSFKNYRSPKYSFSWKKVIKKEKNGFSAVFLVFALFHIVAEWYSGHEIYLTWLIYTAAGSFVVYLILKILKRYTQVFEEANR